MYNAEKYRGLPEYFIKYLECCPLLARGCPRMPAILLLRHPEFYIRMMCFPLHTNVFCNVCSQQEYLLNICNVLPMVKSFTHVTWCISPDNCWVHWLLSLYPDGGWGAASEWPACVTVQNLATGRVAFLLATDHDATGQAEGSRGGMSDSAPSIH